MALLNLIRRALTTLHPTRKSGLKQGSDKVPEIITVVGRRIVARIMPESYSLVPGVCFQLR
ncbi:MAG: hypothetical protein ACKO9W_06935, partial [Bacteroidota bacterium]